MSGPGAGQKKTGGRLEPRGEPAASAPPALVAEAGAGAAIACAVLGQDDTVGATTIDQILDVTSVPLVARVDGLEATGAHGAAGGDQRHEPSSCLLVCPASTST